MFKFVMPALLAGLLGSAALAPAPVSAAEATAQSRFAGLQESGAAIDYARFRGGRGGIGRGGMRRGGFAGGRGLRRGGFAGRGGYGRGGYGYRRGGIGGGAVLGGLAAGALIGGAIASQAQPAPAYAGDPTAYCVQRFRSYDPASGTYLGNDGARHACP